MAQGNSQSSSQSSSSNGSRFTGKVAVVTGASKGIGAEIATHLASQGASVVVNYASSKAGADAVVAQITAAGGRAIAVKADLSNESDVRTLFVETKKAFGRLDVLVNNAGVYDFAPLEQVTAESFHKQFNLNVLGLLFASQEAARAFDGSGGSIVNISSVVSTLSPPNASVYGATKAAVDSITRSLSKELGARNIRVNSVNPGLVATEGSAAFSNDESDFRKQFEAQTPLGRIGQVSDIAPLVAFLASDDAAWMTGETYYVGGGVR
jgi:3-oxoacyl-[acyl-carrier protein] reductase